MMKVHVLHTGSVRVDRAIPFREKNPLAVTGFFRGKEKKLLLPVSCYLVDHPKGLVLFDTGWDSKYADEKPREMGGVLDRISSPVLSKGDSVDRQMEKLGVKSSDLDYVVLSHMDFDHTSGLSLVKDARHIIASRAEIEAADRPSFRYVPSTWKGIAIEPFDYGKGGIGPFGLSHDLFHDGSVLLVSTPGHSAGLCSMVVRNEEGDYVALVSDVGYAARSWREMILPGFTVDKQKAEASLEWAKRCSMDTHCREVLANHDPDVIPHVIEL